MSLVAAEQAEADIEREMDVKELRLSESDMEGSLFSPKDYDHKSSENFFKETKNEEVQRISKGSVRKGAVFILDKTGELPAVLTSKNVDEEVDVRAHDAIVEAIIAELMSTNYSYFVPEETSTTLKPAEIKAIFRQILRNVVRSKGALANADGVPFLNDLEIPIPYPLAIFYAKIGKYKKDGCKGKLKLTISDCFMSQLNVQSEAWSEDEIANCALPSYQGNSSTKNGLYMGINKPSEYVVDLENTITPENINDTFIRLQENGLMSDIMHAIQSIFKKTIPLSKVIDVPNSDSADHFASRVSDIDVNTHFSNHFPVSDSYFQGVFCFFKQPGTNQAAASISPAPLPGYRPTPTGAQVPLARDFIFLEYVKMCLFSDHSKTNISGSALWTRKGVRCRKMSFKHRMIQPGAFLSNSVDSSNAQQAQLSKANAQFTTFNHTDTTEYLKTNNFAAYQLLQRRIRDAGILSMVRPSYERVNPVIMETELGSPMSTTLQSIGIVEDSVSGEFTVPFYQVKDESPSWLDFLTDFTDEADENSFYANRWELSSVPKPEDHMTFDTKKLDAAWKAAYLLEATGEGVPDSPYKTAGAIRTLAEVHSGWDHNDSLVEFGGADKSGSQSMYCYFIFTRNDEAKYHFLIAKDTNPDSGITITPFTKTLIGTVRSVTGVNLFVAATYPISSDAYEPIEFPKEMCHSGPLKDRGNFPSQIFQISSAAFMEGSSSNLKRAELQEEHAKMPNEFLGMIVPPRAANSSCGFWADLSSVIESGIAAVGDTFKFVTTDTVSTDEMVESWSDLFLSGAKLGNSIVDLFPPVNADVPVIKEANKIVIDDEIQKVKRRIPNSQRNVANTAIQMVDGRRTQNPPKRKTSPPKSTSRGKGKGKGKGAGRNQPRPRNNNNNNN